MSLVSERSSARFPFRAGLAGLQCQGGQLLLVVVLRSGCVDVVRHRVAALDGTLSLESPVGGGTVLRAKIPLP